jgi:HTH-type transcriptional regulator/antitoxin HipB
MQVIDDAETLGATIRARRKDLELSQEDLATLARVSVRVLSSLEGGKPTTRLDIVMPVLSALGLAITLAPKSTP